MNTNKEIRKREIQANKLMLRSSPSDDVSGFLQDCHKERTETEQQAKAQLPEDCVFLGWGGEFPLAKEHGFIFATVWDEVLGGWGTCGRYSGTNPNLLYACPDHEYTVITGMLLDEVEREKETEITMTEEEFKKSIDNAQDAICQQLSYIIKNTVGWAFIRDQNHLYEKLLKMGVKP